MYRLVLIRHGESQWNLENRFTGWTDVDLTGKGVEEARSAGRLIKKKGIGFDLAFTSVLKRAIRTLWLILDEMDLMWLPVRHSWRLNERMYGALQGLNKAETAARYGDEQVLIWRRSYATPPPLLDKNDDRYPGRDPRYGHLAENELPLAESLEQTIDRFMPYWEKSIAPAIRSGKRVIIAAHGNSLRGIVKHIDRVSNEDILKLNIPTGIPLVYKLDNHLRAVEHEYLGDPEAIRKAVETVAAQAKAPRQ